MPYLVHLSVIFELGVSSLAKHGSLMLLPAMLEVITPLVVRLHSLHGGPVLILIPPDIELPVAFSLHLLLLHSHHLHLAFAVFLLPLSGGLTSTYRISHPTEGRYRNTKFIFNRHGLSPKQSITS